MNRLTHGIIIRDTATPRYNPVPSRSPPCSAHPFQILSDLHLEKPPAYSFFDIPARAPHLALPGDVGNACDSGFFVFIETQLQNFKTVYFLLGNHEPYHSSWKEVRQKADEFAALVKQRLLFGVRV
ncbi:serine/threonine phosphatase [Histoplasma capsulatum G186AR]|uniref:Serine/threonine phosphatase n=1 Tax=Ajellomyces capsulatus TaxID=5037 RepID=A0A8H7YG01_AJECA|nr:serine/threonine phosphatase [Histoplasma capsulatum]QSS73393.1 serine/threonine phosphatase [Histoplasma capsulatum G186AR]